jgi:hypothetical protein
MLAVRSFARLALRTSWSLAALALLAAAPLAAQESPVVSAAELNGALTDRSAEVDADRAAVQATLARPEVADVARNIGVDIEDARRAAGTLSGVELARAVAASQNVEQTLAGGQTFSISAITLIVVLLVVILLVLIL